MESAHVAYAPRPRSSREDRCGTASLARSATPAIHGFGYAFFEILDLCGKVMEVHRAGVLCLHNPGDTMGANSRSFQRAETFRFGKFLFDSGSRQLLHHGVE